MAEIKTRDLTCIICPRGCALNVEIKDGQVQAVTGNSCPRGSQYAVSECTHPMRTVTSTVRAENGSVVPVKTSRPIPKERMFDCMKAIAEVTVALPVSIGDVVVPNLLGLGADIVVTANKA